MNKIDNFSILTNAYYQRTEESFALLADKLESTTNRLKFEEWLINVTPQLPSHFAWHTKIIAMLVENLAETNGIMRKDEDLLLARIISKASPLSNDECGLVEKITGLSVTHSLGMTLDLEEILGTIQTYNKLTGVDLPFTSNILLKRILKDYDIPDLCKKAIEEDWFLVIKMLVKHHFKDIKDLLPELLYFAIDYNRLAIFKVFANALQDDLSSTLISRDEHGKTLVAYAVSKDRREMLKIMAEKAPEAFSQSITMQDSQGNTPIADAISNVELLKLLYSLAPDSFKKAFYLRDCYNCSPFDMLKIYRPKNYKEITDLFEKNHELRIIHKEMVNRVALAHFWNISGTTDFYDHVQNKMLLANVSLTGWYPETWFQDLTQDLDRFKEAYPDQLSELELQELKETCIKAATLKYDKIETLKEIKSGKLTLIKAGFKTHLVILLILGKHFVICNRGCAMRRPLDFFHFDPDKFDLKILKKIFKVRYSGSEGDYEKLFFEELLTKSVIFKTDLDRRLDREGFSLPEQDVGNCTVVSLATGFFGYRLLEGIRKIKETATIEEIQNEAASWYNAWLSFQQMLVLERGAQRLNDKTQIKHDYKLITEVFDKAHRIEELDEICQQKLNDCKTIYLNSLKTKKRAFL